MHGYEYDAESTARPKAEHASRAEGADPRYRAAALGRTDVLGAGGLLGLQRAAGNAGVNALVEQDRAEEEPAAHAEKPAGTSLVRDVVGSGAGVPLDAATRSEMEHRFGQDFGDVRIHTDAAAQESARSMEARAYTVGSSIAFQRDAYDPSSAQGRHVLAHELTHVLQQRDGPVDGTDAGCGLKVSDPSDRFEREAAATADRLMSATPTSAPGTGQRVAAQAVEAQTVAAPRVEAQRQAEPGEEAQRQAEPGEEAQRQAEPGEEREDEERLAQTYVQRESDEEEPE